MFQYTRFKSGTGRHFQNEYNELLTFGVLETLRFQLTEASNALLMTWSSVT